MTDSDATSSLSPRLCPTCGEEIGDRDKFCPICGANLARASAWVATTSTAVRSTPDTDNEIHPLPSGKPEPRRRRPKKKAPWYRRPLIILPLVAVLLLGGVAGVIAWKTQSALKDVHSLSTPPPEVDASSLGGDEGTVIDTGPALAALEARESRSTTDTPPTESPTESPTTTTTQPSSSGAGTTGDATSGTPAGGSVTLASATPDGAVSLETGPSPEAASPVADSTPVVSTGPTIEPTSPPVVASEGLTVLLMGVDSRDGESIDIGVRPDSLAVLHIEEETGSCRILAVPRDSRAQLPGYGYSKINHALAVAGVPYEMLVVEEYLGLEIDNYALIDFNGLEAVVNSLGGITVDNPAAFEMDGKTFAAGSIQLDGEQALLYSRFRGDDQGDFGRISRQQQVLRAMMNEATDLNVVTTLPNMFSMLSDHFRTDFGVGDLVTLANDYRSTCTASSIEAQTIPGDVRMEYDELMQQDLSFVVSDPAVVKQNVDWLLGKADDQASGSHPSNPVAMMHGGSSRSGWHELGRRSRHASVTPTTS